MIRFINCVKRRDDVDVGLFRHYWYDPQFEALQARVAQVLGASRYQRSLTLAVEANELIREQRGLEEPFDGTIEYWWDQAREVMRRSETSEGRRVLGAMLEYQEQFIALSECRAFFTEA